MLTLPILVRDFLSLFPRKNRQTPHFHLFFQDTILYIEPVFQNAFTPIFARHTYINIGIHKLQEALAIEG